MSKHPLTLPLILLATLLAGCVAQPAAAVPVSTEPATSEWIEPATPSPAAPAVPQAILDQLPKLQAAGLRIQENAQGWALVSRTGNATVSAAQAPNMISIVDETGAAIEYSADSYELREMAVVGLDSIQLVKDTQGNVERFYLEEENVWVTPIEQFGDFARLKEDINLCPRIEKEDVWSGRWLGSVTLVDTDPISENVKLPDYMMYWLTSAPGGYWIMLQDVVDGLPDVSGHAHLGINRDNDYRDFLNCGLLRSENGEDMVLATERVITPDRKRLYLSYGFGYGPGGEWSLVENVYYGSSFYNLVDSVLLARDTPKPDGYAAKVLRPLIFFEAAEGALIKEWLGGSVANAPSTGNYLYDLPQNDPTGIFSDFDSIPLVRGQIQEAGPEISKLQYMILMSTWIGSIFPDYFTSAQN